MGSSGMGSSGYEQGAEERHDVGLAAASVLPCQYDGLIVAEEPDPPPRPGTPPRQDRGHDGEQLLPLDRVLGLVGLPRVMEPGTLEVGSAAEGTSGVREQLHVGCRGSCLGYKLGGAVPRGQERLPPGDVGTGVGGQPDVVVELRDCGAQSDQASEEQAACGNCSSGKG